VVNAIDERCTFCHETCDNQRCTGSKIGCNHGGAGETNFPGNDCAGAIEIAIHNVGGIRAVLSKGVITWGNAFEVLPFQNTLITLKMTGAQLKKTLERGLVSSVGMVAVSGIRVQFDTSKPAGEQVVSVVLLDGNKIEDSKLYTVATNDFVLAGGDGFTEFANGTDIVNTGIILRDVFVEYIKTHRTISPQLDGRIVVR
jgi:2',3'-cyclic-nucleotide 2'-phosphodiesterase/3'-nucleotidase